ncbi:MAG: CRISPR-associated protein Cas4 [Methanobacteriota archaeon]
MSVHVSSLAKYDFCPRVIYLEEVLGVTPKPSEAKEKGLVGHTIRKELSLRQAKALGKIREVSELEKILIEELERIFSEAPRIYVEKLEGIDYDRILDEIRPQIMGEIKVTLRKLSGLVGEVGLERAQELVTPEKVEYSIRSESLGLSGRVDKIMIEDEKHIPVEIKTGKMGDSVWSGDRLQVGGYILLCDEKFTQTTPYGYVEYTQACDTRPVLATEKLRRQALEVRDKVEEIIGGNVPEICPHGSGRKCDSCGMKDECYSI